jgi:hypothetical protein
MTPGARRQSLPASCVDADVMFTAKPVGGGHAN